MIYYFFATGGGKITGGFPVTGGFVPVGIGGTGGFAPVGIGATGGFAPGGNFGAASTGGASLPPFTSPKQKTYAKRKL